MVEATKNEPDCLYYGFTFHEDDNGAITMFCRESYKNGKAVLAHLANVGGLINEFLDEQEKIAELIKIEFHGPKEECKEFEQAVQGFNPKFFYQEANTNG